ncbi:hypothetical protein RhiTH_009002 [Rhizoctonia solani]
MLPENLRKAMFNGIKMAGKSVKVDDRTFDWDGFKSVIARQGTALTLDFCFHNTVSPGSGYSQSMADAIADLLFKNSNLKLNPDTLASLSTVAHATRHNLVMTETSGGFLGSYHESSGTASSRMYKVFPALRNDQTTTEFYFFVLTVEMNYKTREKSTEWGRSTESSSVFSADVTCMRLTIPENFAYLE